MLKTAFIGVGNWGKRLLEEYSVYTEVVWCMHKNNPSTHDFINKNYPSVKQTSVLQDILNDQSIDIVVVATPTDTHFDIAKNIIESGKHLFLEKPGGTSSTQLQTLHTLAKEHNVSFMVNYEFVYHPVWQYIQKNFGNDITAIHSEWFKWGSFKEPSTTNLLCHDISIIKSTHNTITPIVARTHPVISTSDILFVEYCNKKIRATSYINRVHTDKHKTITLSTTQGNFIWHNDTLFRTTPQNEYLEIPILDKSSAIQNSIKHFIHAVTHKKPIFTDGLFAFEVMCDIEKVISLQK